MNPRSGDDTVVDGNAELLAMDKTSSNEAKLVPLSQSTTIDAGQVLDIRTTNATVTDGAALEAAAAALTLPPGGGDSTSSSHAKLTATMKVSRARGVAVIATLSGMNFLNTMGSGILIAALPRIARDLAIPDGLMLWPAATYALSAGCLLLLFGTLSDALSAAKPLWLLGSTVYALLTIALGQSSSPAQLILFRTCLGAAVAMCLPTSVSLIVATFPDGGWKNAAFAMGGMAQPLGYALGLVLGGVFTDGIGWRWAYYIMAIINGVLAAMAVWSLPEVKHASPKSWHRRLLEDIDWVGVLIMCTSLGMLLYVLARLTSDYHCISAPETIALLTVSLALLGCFPLWMRFQTLRGRPALIPNHLWTKATFTSACVGVFFCWASLNSFEYFTTLFFQEVQGLSALQSSVRYFAQIVIGTSTNVVLVYVLPRVPVVVLAAVSASLTLISPALMAIVAAEEMYWFRPFWALLLCPINPWVLFSVSNLMISDSFPTHLQSLAGGVFNEVAQFGNSVGLAVAAAIAASVTEQSSHRGEKVPKTEALMDGYRVAFWTIFVSTAVVLVVTTWGFRRAGIVGKAKSGDDEVPKAPATV